MLAHVIFSLYFCGVKKYIKKGTTLFSIVPTDVSSIFYEFKKNLEICTENETRTHTGAMPKGF